ncbi:outer membrane protein assembly factor BamB family protein [Roseimaritima ulvae]|uniref:Outer membrane biogenesis protein BamB n=1 Tax=Roseimaritima ulvae TaxID=980254 RepID=A0A5B9QTA2_9BACT|nr:PQQ-binding-like beta-propeller repeat protein [Roseimaritima ulvae]QEG40635.1 outer membrane biogenesis protein BamB [Roseimaritima ulvae]
MLRKRLLPALGLLSLGLQFSLASPTLADDWLRFRGPNGTGLASSSESPPIEWSEEKNLRWSLDLLGPGHSSPIVVGDKVFLTCWTGYGVDDEESGKPEDLKRHLLCVDRASGKLLWERAVAARLPEDEYAGMFAEHGYASHTPVSDGQYVFCFFGKSGVHAFDLEGNPVWQAEVGEGLDQRKWGSASSLILTDELVIVTAGPESGTLYGLDKKTGETRWNANVGLSGMWGTPLLAPVDEKRTDLVVGVPDEVWGLNPATGKLRWYCDGIEGGSVNSSPVLADSVVYMIDGRNGDALAVRVGGKGDVNQSHVVWHESHRGRISSPIVHDGLLYWISSGVLNCVDAATGERVYQERLNTSDNSATRGPSRRGGRGGQDYGSPVVAGDHLFYINRRGIGVVVQLGKQFKQLATNTFDGASGDFSATPAIADGQLFIRSTKKLYCVAEPTDS